MTGLQDAGRSRVKYSLVPMTARPSHLLDTPSSSVSVVATVDTQYAMWAAQKQERIRLGDNLIAPRTVEHFAAFKRSKRAEEAATALRALGFQVVIGRRRMKTALQADRTDPLTDEDVRRFVHEVATLVETHGGEYDGWGAETAD